MLKQEANDGMVINKLPPELLGHIFHLTTATAKQPIRNAVRASTVCRQWRAVALSMPHIWSRLEDSARTLSLDLFRLCLERSKTLPISVSCSDRWHGGALQEHGARLKHLAFAEPLVAFVLRDISVPLLETLRIAGSGSPYLLPDDLFGNYAPRLTHLAVRWDILSANRQYGFVGGVTRLDLLHVPGLIALGPDLPRLAHFLRQLPHLIVLTGVCPTEDDSSIPSNIPLANLEELHALDTEAEERFLLAPFELLQHERIPKIFIARPSRAMYISTCRSTSPIVYAKLDRLRRQAVFRDDNSFTRTFTDCKVHKVPCEASLLPGASHAHRRHTQHRPQPPICDDPQLGLSEVAHAGFVVD
ncbi:hypothetical protein EXIGLDRAFT_28075 [Exidia glandulosa HHB12029]|uniref:F-box domain-containing protein n=1 Tax=Exidia glandulosa HHB12029 TaxID=1314781 RepID=A0A165P9H5_EXIGL|nr:hypothetical protein EXIGLDRAFT_28075 [Exidia glandulosa HHB12029]